MLVVSLIIGVCFALGILAVRMQASKRPASVKKIILPPIFMSSGFLMFIEPQFRPPIGEAVAAFLVGCLFSILLIKTSKFEIRGNDIYLKRSRAFIFVLLGLLVLRTVMKAYVGGQVTVTVTGGLFFILAFGMILPWRIGMYVGYKKRERQLHEPVST
ncbi:MAG TPA: cytochrome c biogenesis protein CcdC [Bacillales bacterium]|nr:cytochrome c biogenesis protein CcdC [Bacillales bacterium]